MNTSELLSHIDTEISRLKEARALLAGHDGSAFPTLQGHRKKRHISPEAREKIAAAQRKRWAKYKKAAK
jgi:hypothetical protein